MAGDRWFFDRIAPIYDSFMPSIDPAVVADTLAHSGRPVERALDLGGGTGRAIREVDANDRIVLDLSRPMLSRVPAGIARVRGDGRRLPIAAGSVDAVLITDALHHFPDRERVLLEAERVLRPGGVLVVREFDPGTRRGAILEAAEHLFGMDSTFSSPGALRDMVDGVGLDGTVIDAGFSYTVVGRKPGV